MELGRSAEMTPAMLTTCVRERHPRTHIVALSENNNSAFIASLLRALVSAHIYMPAAHMDNIITAVEIALDDSVYLCPHSKQAMLRMLDSAISLTTREIEIARALAQQPDSTFEELAPQLYMSSGTLRSHLKNLRIKLGLANSTEIPTTVRELGLIE